MLQILLYLVVGMVAVWLVVRLYRYQQFLRLEDPAHNLTGKPVPVAADLGGARDLADLLEPIRRAHKLPALAAALVKDGRLVALGAVGARRAVGAERVGVHDRFHLGSCTKALTATLCALLVRQGKLRWETTIAEVFPDQADQFLPAYHGVTLE